MLAKQVIQPANDLPGIEDMVIPVRRAERVRIELVEHIHGGADQVKLPPAHFVGVKAAGVGVIAGSLPDVVLEVVVAEGQRLLTRLNLERFHQPDFLAEHADLFQVHHAALIQDCQDPPGEFFPFVLRDGPVAIVAQIFAHTHTLSCKVLVSKMTPL